MAAAATFDADLNDPVTSHMHTDFARLVGEQTVGEALATIRQNPPVGWIVYFYVLDREGRLIGVVPTRRLLLSPQETPVAEIMIKDVVAMASTATVLDACEFFTLHRLLAFPILDAERRMLGIVDVELYTKELKDIGQSERKDDLFQLIGVHLAEAQQSSPFAAFRQRFPWLICNIAGGIVAAFIAGFFEAELQKAVALALFIPVVLALSESVAIQSVSLALQVLHGQKPTVRSLLNKLHTEMMTGLFLGVAGGVAVSFVAAAWLGQIAVAGVILAGITIGVTFSALFGVAMPNILRLLQRDPQVAAGPVALAAADMVTLLAYFNIARWFLS